MIRAFVAIKITPDEEFLRAFQVLKIQLVTEQIKWVDIENLHLTLKFLGNITVETAQLLKQELKKINSIPTFQFQVTGIHLFKDIHAPQIIYSEIKSGPEWFKLTKELDNSLNALNFIPSEKKFLPHLTLGRIKLVKGKNNLEMVLQDLRTLFCQQVECNEFILFESILTPSGPIYKPLETINLL